LQVRGAPPGPGIRLELRAAGRQGQLPAHLAVDPASAQRQLGVKWGCCSEDSGGDLVSTWASKQRRACRGPDHLVNPFWKHYKRQRRAFRSSRLTPAGRCTSLLMGQAEKV